jgi:hypothetical protein
MLDPDIIAKSVVAYWHRGPYPLHTFDENDPDTATEIADIAAALRAYGDARAAQEREHTRDTAIDLVKAEKGVYSYSPSSQDYKNGYADGLSAALAAISTI